MMYYSASTNGFYLEPHSSNPNIPVDAKEISDELHAQLLKDNSEGKVIQADENGLPVSVVPVVDPEYKAKRLRARRVALLKESDVIVMRHYETQTPVPADWVKYRQDLRDLPEQPGFPLDVVWPVKPA